MYFYGNEWLKVEKTGIFPLPTNI